MENQTKTERKMKKQTFSYRTAPRLTQVVKQLMEKDGYQKSTRQAMSGSGDDVHTIKNPNGEFILEFCIKTHPTMGHNYVNWARVYGTEVVFNKFCEAVQFEQVQEQSNVFTAKL